MRQFRFYKDIDKKWYVDLPEWTGPKADLEMVIGADLMLEFMSQGTGEVLLNTSEDEFDGSDKIDFIRESTELENGSFYKLENYKGVKVDQEMWLCDVIKFVYGYFPETIYIK